MTAVVIGVGNEYRHDDGVGPAVVAELGRLMPAVRATVSDGEPASLLEAWSRAELAVVVDAVLCEPSEPGRIWRSTVDDLGAVLGTASSHALGIPDAVRLAKELDRLPGRLLVFAVEAADLSLGVGLTPPVAAAVPRVVEAITGELP
ncbi:hydrogenase maturation protease [Amycolatopsis alkalitolerans]|uniref:Hydrogenase maturation protease n=1 Tax=Amycolatopsis alkalitolerans TaxID=2547244 RepID=A0A5C4M0Z7_9PSEU|nr:hydrogenase maturation protease [Amycolatopsis alkalitolerans]TNC24171.1 hydrogenase maturation protease [Amycolatopsis alkalitolerans]